MDLLLSTKIGDAHNDNKQYVRKNQAWQEVEVPTKTSELTNDGDGTNPFLTQHQSLSAYRTSAAQDVIDSGKVDKVTGKQLSTEDYTTAEKTKLSGIAARAEVNVQSDWTQTNTSADDYIKNKPSTFPPATHNHDDRYYTETEADAKFLTEHQ